LEVPFCCPCTGGWGKSNISLGGAFRKAKYKKLRRRKKEAAERSGAAEFPPHPPSAVPSQEAKIFSPPVLF